jgi:hypothetical protein
MLINIIAIAQQIAIILHGMLLNIFYASGGRIEANFEINFDMAK